MREDNFLRNFVILCITAVVIGCIVIIARSRAAREPRVVTAVERVERPDAGPAGPDAGEPDGGLLPEDAGEAAADAGEEEEAADEGEEGVEDEASPSVTLEPGASPVLARALTPVMLDVEQCYVETLQAHPGLHGTTRLMFVIERLGKGHGIIVPPPRGGAAWNELRACALAKLTSFRYPNQPHQIQGVVELRFDPGTQQTEPQVQDAKTRALEYISKKRFELYSCAGPQLAMLIVQLEVAKDGSLRMSRITRSSGDRVVDRCVKDQIERWTFPPGPLEITVPFIIPTKGR